MSTLTLDYTVNTKLPDAIYVPPRSHSARPAPKRPSLSHRVAEWFDTWTDDRSEIERYLARSQNVADLENRIRIALMPQRTLDF